MSDIPGDLAITLIRRAFLALDGLGVPTGRASCCHARWRMHPEAVDDLKRHADRIKLGPNLVLASIGSDPVSTASAVTVEDDHEWTLLGMTIVQDSTLAVTDLRFEVEA